MTFAHPGLILVAMVLAPLLGLGFLWSWRTRLRLIGAFVPKRLQEALTLGVSPRRAAVRATLITFGLVSLVFALSRPRFGAGTVEVNQRGLDILVAVDTSRSMLAEDAGPGISRLQRAKLAALDLARLAKTDRIGLVAFAGGAFLQCPLTIDFEAFRQSVDALDTSVIQQGGTSIGSAIHTAIDAFSEERSNVRALVIFTDGEEHETGAFDAARRAESKGLRVFTVGVGTAQGEVVRLRDAEGKVSYLKDSQGNAVKSALNESLLKSVAEQAGGLYLPLQGPRAMHELYTRGLEPLPKGDLDARLMEQFEERFQFPLGLAICLILLESLLPEYGRVGNRIRAARPSHPTLQGSAATQTAAAIVLPLLVLAASSATALAVSPSKALQHYRKADYTAAQAEFERLAKENPKEPRLHFNAGTAAYRAGNFEAASGHFRDSLASTDLKLQSDAFYNLGNSQFKVGESVPDPKVRQRAWEQAIQSYEAAVKLAPQNPDAAHNLEFVRQQLQDLKQQQKSEDQQNQGKNQDSKDGAQDEESSEPKQDSEDSKPEQKPKQDSEQQSEKSDSQDQEPKDKNDGQSSQPDDPSENASGKDSEEKSPPKPQPNEEDSKNPQSTSNADSGNSQTGDVPRDGQMTPQQALRLLDGTRGEEKRMPLEKKRARARILKDW